MSDLYYKTTNNVQFIVIRTNRGELSGGKATESAKVANGGATAMKTISKQRFDCLAGYARNPLTVLYLEEMAGFASDDERLLAIVVRDRIDADFGWIAMGKDERLRYRAVDVRGGMATEDEALASLRRAMPELMGQPEEFFHQGDGAEPPVDFFTPIVAPERVSPTFRLLAEAERYAPARAAVSAMMRYHEDVDGNFVQLFQSSGFDARLWELYLFAAMTELGYGRAVDVQVPDFVLKSAFGELAIEAVTCNPPRNVGVPMPQDVDGMLDYQRNYIPIKLGRALTRKLRREPPYWQGLAVQDMPFVLAVQDFHAPGAMRHIVIAATEYVFGVRHERQNGVLRVERIADHRYDGLTEPSGLFTFEESENISAVLLNPQGTITKFNRMGYLAGFEQANIRMVRTGVARGERNQADSRPVAFMHEVHAPGYEETWVEGMVVLHNPNARIPLDPDLIPFAAHEFLQPDGRIMSLLPEFHPLYSQTQIFVTRGSENAAQVD